MPLDEVRRDALRRALAELAAPGGAARTTGDRACRLARCVVEVLPAGAGAVLVRDARGGVEASAASGPEALRLAQLELDRDTGPGLECLRTNRPVDAGDLAAAANRWPAWTAAAVQEGWDRVHAVPVREALVRAREGVDIGEAGPPSPALGALVLLGRAPERMTPEDMAWAGLLAEVAGSGLAVDRQLERQRRVIAQLQEALDSRVLIEQAKGILAERGGLDMTGAFERLRAYARTHRMRLLDAAAQVVSGEGADAVLSHAPSLRPGRRSPP